MPMSLAQLYDELLLLSEALADAIDACDAIARRVDKLNDEELKEASSDQAS